MSVISASAQDREFESCPLDVIDKGWGTKTITNVINGSLGIMLESFNRTWPTWMGGAICETMEQGLAKRVLDKETALTVTIDTKNGYAEVDDGGTDGAYMSACFWNRVFGTAAMVIASSPFASASPPTPAWSSSVSTTTMPQRRRSPLSLTS